MISRLHLLLPLLSLVSLCFAARNKTTTADLGIPTINFAQSHYDFDNCGKSTAGRARRDMGDDYIDGMDFELGETGDAAVGEIPWAVAVIINVPDIKPRICAGTLISKRHVLSAAHCLSTADELPTSPGYPRCKPTDHISLNDFVQYSVVKFGGECIHDAACEDQSMAAKTIDIKNVTLFPFFWEDCSRGSDLIIIELVDDVPVPHACLPHLHDLEDPTLRNKTATTFHTFGWGTDKSRGVDSADRLQKTSLSLLEDRCAKLWDFLSHDVLCAPPGKHIGQCLGDSGAGLMTTSFGRAFLIGVLSSSGKCGPAGGEQTPESRFTDVRLFTATIDIALRTNGTLLDFSHLIEKKKKVEL